MTSRIVSTVSEASEPDRVTAVDRLVMLLEALDGAEGVKVVFGHGYPLERDTYFVVRIASCVKV